MKRLFYSITKLIVRFPSHWQRVNNVRAYTYFKSLTCCPQFSSAFTIEQTIETDLSFVLDKHIIKKDGGWLKSKSPPEIWKALSISIGVELDPFYQSWALAHYFQVRSPLISYPWIAIALALIWPIFRFAHRSIALRKTSGSLSEKSAKTQNRS